MSLIKNFFVKESRQAYALLLVLAVGGFLLANNVFAAVAITTATGGTNISADSAANASSPAFTTLGDIVITEGANTDFPANASSQTLVLTAPAGWQFNAGFGSVSHLGTSAGSADITSESVVVTSSEITVTFSTDANANKSDTLTISGIQVQAVDGAVLPSSGNILSSASGTAVISGITNGLTNFGSLSQVAGTAIKLAFSTQPGNGEYGSFLSPQPVVKSQDQFGNNSTVGLAASELVTLTHPTGSGILQGDIDLDIGTGAGNGTVTFTDIGVDTIGTGNTLEADSPNLTSTGASTTFDVNQKSLLISGVVANNKVYDGTTDATLDFSSASLSGVVLGDDVSMATTSAVGIFVDKNIGAAKTVTVSGITLSGADSDNYTLTQPTATADITALPIIVTAVSDIKIYDSTNSSTLTPTTDMPLATGDSATWTQTFDNPNVGTNKTITPAGTITDGNGGNNYAVTFVANTTGEITQYQIEVTADTQSKIYGDADPALTYQVTSGVLQGADTFSGALSRDAGEDVGAYAINQSTLALTSNYSLTYVPADLAISPKVITAILNVNNKTYNGTTSAVYSSSLPHVVLVGVLGGDDVNPSDGASKAFSDKNVGTSKTVTAVGITLSGADVGNYSFDGNGTGTADINPRPVTVTAQTDTKVYDSTTSSSVSPVITSTFSPAVAVVDTANFMQTFDTPNVGTNKTLTASGSVDDGNGGNNYAVTFVANTTGEITQYQIEVTADTQSKIYGDADPALTYQVTSGVLQGADTFSGALSRDAGEDVGAYAINQGTLSLSSDYNLTYVPNTLTVDPKTIAATIDADNKVYDANINATFSSITLFGAIVGDDVYGTGGAATFDTKHVGTNKAVTATGITLAGTDATNYSFNGLAAGQADITARPLTITGTTDTKVYDGTFLSSAIPTITVGTLQGTDTANFSQVFDSKNVAVGKSMIPSGNVYDGNGGANYTYTFVNDITGVITAKSINVTAQTDTKVYDGTNSSSVAPVVDALEVGDSVSVVPIQTFDTEDVGSGKTLTPSGLVISDGNGGANYNLTYVGNNTGEITPAALTIADLTADNKVYDGTTVATLSGSASLVGVIGGDVVSLDGVAIGTFASTTVGVYDVNVTGLTIIGADSGNYTLTLPVLSAEIMPLAITITPNAGQSKVYGASEPVFTYTNTPALIGGDVFTGALARVAGENAGTYSFTLGTLSAGANYSLTLAPETFEIVKANPLIVWSNPASIFSGTALSATQLNATTTTAGTFVYDPISGTVLAVGTHTLTSVFTPTDTLNYNNATTTVSITVSAPVPPESGGGGGGGGGNGAINAVAAAGDINGDGTMDITDFNILMTNWGRTGSGIPGDLNGDGTVDILDFNLLMANWR